MSDTHLRVTEHATPVIESTDPDLLYVDEVRVAAGEVLTDRDDLARIHRGRKLPQSVR